MRTISFYSYKGGVGRSLALANIARELAGSLGKKVFALDLDLEAPGLHYKLLSNERRQAITLGVVDYLHSFLADGRVPRSLEDHVVEVEESSKKNLFLMPAGRVPSAAYWRRLSEMSWHKLFYEDDSRGIPLFLELKERIRQEYQPDYLLIDARTGITELGGVATTLLPDQVICLLAHEPESLEGARAVLRSIKQTPRIQGQAEVEVLPVITRVPLPLKPRDDEEMIENVRRFLNEPAENLSETISLTDILVLHWPNLQVRERLLQGDPQAETSALLEGCLRLCEKIISYGS